MLFLLVSSLLLTTCQCNLRDNKKEYLSLNKHGEIVGHYELFDAVINDLCTDYPSLRPSSDAELITFKKEFMEFIVDSAQLQVELLSGFPSRFKVLPGKIAELTKFMKKDFKELSKEDQDFIKKPMNYLMDKLLVEYPLRIIKKRQAEYKKRRLTEEQIKEEVAERQHKTFLAWHEKDDLVEVVSHWRERIEKYEL